jgi:hypothetical protein
MRCIEDGAKGTALGCSLTDASETQVNGRRGVNHRSLPRGEGEGWHRPGRRDSSGERGYGLRPARVSPEGAANRRIAVFWAVAVGPIGVVITAEGLEVRGVQAWER